MNYFGKYDSTTTTTSDRNKNELNVRIAYIFQNIIITNRKVEVRGGSLESVQVTVEYLQCVQLYTATARPRHVRFFSELR
jgi:hypothetical protein